MARAKDDTPPKPRKQRFATLRQIGQAYSLTSKNDKQLPLWLAGTFLLVLAVFVVIGALIGHPYYLGFIGILFGLLATMVVFGRRAQRAAYGSIEGQVGAAAAVLDSLKRGWTVTPGIAATRQQDIVHRAVGRPGIVLVGEGSPARLAGLLAQERKKLGRVVPDVPVHDFQVGKEQGQLSLQEFQRTLAKLPKVIPSAQIDTIDKRLVALGTLAQQLPKGPLPKGMRPPRQMR
ncbi:uncharacterized protein DUF4191 [Motilibacter rhizosphaerae]|uniref:Uncharacterized protein DUF4191 n=1 Tax=Motilibacter rhizosphaerae TaxID=598652 RepID=A0A4Q7NRB5_9ACTN|nr:DUF4191 domain-containing protein [Motilibacter rhizosphaerae]RZS89597.1 uncharacterized protein DUF4191 [Motilibacter rhizosphaerae]